MKTAATVLQEMLVKLGKTPEYECIAQNGPQHQAMFEYRCTALGVSVTASARSKKEAKQEAARIMLAALATRGHSIPTPYSMPTRTNPFSSEDQDMGQSQTSTMSGSFVALLRDLCEEYHLPAVDYELIGDTGPAHMRHFTMKVTLGKHYRIATSTSKKAARQLAAQQLYNYLRENLDVTKDFVEEEALVRVHERILERYCEAREDVPWRPDLGQKMDSCHRTVLEYIDIEKRRKAFETLQALNESPKRRKPTFESMNLGSRPALFSMREDNSVEILGRIAANLGLTVNNCDVPTLNSEPLKIVELSPTVPELTFVGKGESEACANALKFIQLSLEDSAKHQDLQDAAMETTDDLVQLDSGPAK